MICTKCGYGIEALDEECRKCKGKTSTSKPWDQKRLFFPTRLAKRFAPLLSILVAGCVVFAIQLAKREDDVLETIVRSAAGAKYKGIAFVSIDGEDPPQSLVNRFRNDGLSVRRWSQAQAIPTRDEKRPTLDIQPVFMKDYQDKVTGETGIPIVLHKPNWTGLWQASVPVESYFAEDDYIVTREGLYWKITDVKPVWAT